MSIKETPSRPAAGDIVGDGIPNGPWWSMTLNGEFEVHTPYAPPAGISTLTEAEQDGPLSEDQKRMHTAVHEAGHALIALAFELPVSAVVLHDVPEPFETVGFKANGHVHIGPYSGAGYRDMLAFHAAGVRAGHRWLADNNMLTALTAFTNDVIHGFGDRRNTIAEKPSHPLQLSYGSGRPHDLPAGHLFLDLADVYHRVDRLLDESWPGVMAIAEALLERGRMEPNEVWVVADRALTPPPWWWFRPEPEPLVVDAESSVEAASSLLDALSAAAAPHCEDNVPAAGSSNTQSRASSDARAQTSGLVSVPDAGVSP